MGLMGWTGWRGFGRRWDEDGGSAASAASSG